MTEVQKNQIKKLRADGRSYEEIAKLTDLAEGTVKSFVSRNKTKPEKKYDFCKCCGKPIKSMPHHKGRKFCSRECGLLWWHQNQNLLSGKAVYSFICHSCGKAFSVYGQRQRKYCSHKCYINARFRGVSYEA